MPGMKKPKAKKATASPQVLPAQQQPPQHQQAQRIAQAVSLPTPSLPAGAMRDESKTLTAPQQDLAWQIAQHSMPGERATPPPVGKAPESSDILYDESEQQFQDVMKDWEASGENIESIAQAQESAAGRRAAEMNAALGRGMGGGFAGGMAQASLTGQRERLSLEQEHQTRGLELQMTHLQDLLKQAEAAKDRDLQLDLQDKISTLMMQLEAVRTGGDLPEWVDNLIGVEQPTTSTPVQGANQRPPEGWPGEATNPISGSPPEGGSWRKQADGSYLIYDSKTGRWYTGDPDSEYYSQ